MPAELPIEQSLVLKKRARRRLVGAIALVLMMLVILPIILQDRVAVNSVDSVNITMNESEVGPSNADGFEFPTASDGIDDHSTLTDSSIANTADTGIGVNGLRQKNSEISQPITQNDAINFKIAELEKKKDAAVEKTLNQKPILQKPTTSTPTTALVETPDQPNALPKPGINPTETDKKAEPTQNTAGFTIQIGVYSDAANVAQLQTKLTQAGFISNTETISTDKGNKIRLRAGSYSTREAANTALTKLQAAGLSGLVMSKAK